MIAYPCSSLDALAATYAHTRTPAIRERLCENAMPLVRRIAKNLTRYGLGIGHEYPATPGFWVSALRDAGLVAVGFQPVIAEAGLVRGIRP